MKSLITQELIERRILLLRGQNVMLDRDLARLYGVKTKVLIQAVKRNIERFPDDFIFQLSKEELENWRSQFVTSNSDKMGLRRAPYAFTDYGILMLSSVLKSKRAVQVNIQIMRTFIKLRKMLVSNKDLLKKIEDMEDKYDNQFKIVFDTIRGLIASEQQSKRRIGFHGP